MTSGQELIQRLREEVQLALAQRTSAVEPDLASLQELVASRLEGIRQKMAEPPAPELPIEGTIAGALDTAEKLQAELMAEARDRTTQLAEFARRMRSQETQEEILNCLADGAARYSSRLAILLVRPEGWAGWTGRGLPDNVLARIRALFVETGRSPLLAASLESGAASTEGPEESPLAEALAGDGQGPWHAVCLRAMGKSVAVIAAAGSAERACDPAALQVLVELAGLNLENMALRVLQEIRATAQAPAEPVAEAPKPTAETFEPAAASTEPPAEVEVPAPPAAEPAPSLEETSEAAPPVEAEAVPQPGEVVDSGESVETAAPAEPAEAEAPAPMIEVAQVPAQGAATPTVIEELDRTLEAIRRTLHEAQTEPAAPEPEAPPATEPEPVPAAEAEPEPVPQPAEVLAAPPLEVPAPPAPPRPEPAAEAPARPPAAAAAPPPAVAPPPPRPAGPHLAHVFSEEEKLHTDAKRFARLLVSEIKLYNEKRVLEGRENRDIYVRLKRDIDRSREVYERRVSPTVARKVDYFHDEIIRILGDNDPTKLGSDYPGPRAES